MMKTHLEQTVVQDLLQDSLSKGQRPSLHVVSNSMAPLLRAGDRIGIEAVDPLELRVGDIVVLRGPSQLVTHRFWGLLNRAENGQLITRGDRGPTFDRPWHPSALVGRVITRRRAGRELSLIVGRGGQLNRLLARLACWDIRWFRPELLEGSSLPVAWPVPAWLRGQRLHRIANRFRFAVASALTLLLN